MKTYWKVSSSLPNDGEHSAEKQTDKYVHKSTL